MEGIGAVARSCCWFDREKGSVGDLGKKSNGVTETVGYQSLSLRVSVAEEIDEKENRGKVARGCEG